MKRNFKRKCFFIHFSSQIKYIAMSILPALITSLFCIYFLMKTSELTLQAERVKLSIITSTLNANIEGLETTQNPEETIRKIEKIKQEVSSLNKILDITYYNTFNEWRKTKTRLLTGLFFILILVGIIALLYSHRIAGPIKRIKYCVEMFTEGKDTSYVHVRGYDEFKELAESLEKLRRYLKTKNILK